MGNLLTILGVLLLALVIIVPLVERFGRRHSDKELNSISRWVIPLLAVLMVAQALRYFFF